MDQRRTRYTAPGGAGASAAEVPERLGDVLAAVDHVSQHLKGNRLHFSNRLFFASAIGHHAREVRHGSQETAIFLSFRFDADWLDLDHGPVPIVAVFDGEPGRGRSQAALPQRKL
jgi:hypothetical protein